MIISASRRTDVPAFYSDWFMNQIRKGKFLRKNPYNGNILETNVEDVKCIVFWTRNANQMLKKGYLKELDDLGIPYYFQYTITGYKKELEKRTLHPLKAIDNINTLADSIGGNKIIWRFDPIVISQYTPVEEIIRLHGKIGDNIHNDINENVISFLDDYKKTGANLKLAGVESQDLLNMSEELNQVLNGISENAKRNSLNVTTCAENIDLEKYGIKKGKCIDGDFIQKQLGVKVSKAKDQGQRKECGCVKSVDIGLYDTCIHGCEYCYATQAQNLANQNYKKHDPENPFIIPDERFNVNNRII